MRIRYDKQPTFDTCVFVVVLIRLRYGSCVSSIASFSALFILRLIVIKEWDALVECQTHFTLKYNFHQLLLTIRLLYVVVRQHVQPHPIFLFPNVLPWQSRLPINQLRTPSFILLELDRMCRVSIFISSSSDSVNWK